MDMNASPLGRYSDLVAAIVSVVLVLAAILAHVNLFGAIDTAWLDTSAGLAVGVILGQRATTNGAAKIATAAHVRLDAMGAPPSNTGGSHP